MNLLNPRTWPAIGRMFRSPAKSNDPGSSVVARSGRTLGVWHDALGGFVPREVNPYFYESLREALPILDGAVNRLVTLDGIVRVEGDNDALVQELNDGLLASIEVNDNEAGLQAAYASQGNELYEQGLGAVEMVMDAKGRELIGLRVADSKGIAFDRDPVTLRLRAWYRPPTRSSSGRRDGTDQIEAVIRGNTRSGNVSELIASHNYAALSPERMVWALLQPEADSPYGVSLMRSMEFASQILLKIENATGQVWDRFGDPPMSLTYKTKNRVLANDGVALAARRSRLAMDLAAVLDAKRNGNSADFVQAIAADDEITIAIIGAKDQILEIEMPARHLLEQIVGKSGVPAWLLGLQWNTSERLAQQQSEMVLQESKTRFERRLPGLRRVGETWLRGRGRTWKPGDWRFVQELPNLHDELKRAQAAFLNAQTAFMQRGGNSGELAPPVPPGTDQGAAKRFRILPDGSMEFSQFEPPAIVTTGKRAQVLAHKAASDGEPWAENDPELPRIESRTIAAMLADWGSLETDTLAALALPTAKAGEQVWTFTPELRPILDALADAFELATGSEEGGLMRGTLAAWRRGVENAAAEIDGAEALSQIADEARATMRARALDLAKSTTTRTFRADIIAELEQGAYNGLNPSEVAKRLRDRFGAHDYDWERLARSEIAQAQVIGKEAEYIDLGVEQYDYITAEDSRVSAICRANAEGSPYPVGAGKLPMRDSHPNCFPAGTLVASARVNASSCRWYEGDLVEILTTAGKLLSVTPNHPILTPDGWVAAGLIEEGGHVFGSSEPERVARLVDPDHHHGPTCIAEVAVTLGGALGVAPVTVPVTAEDFHGDWGDTDVDVVGADCLLRSRIADTSAGEQRDEFTFRGAGPVAEALAGRGGLAQSADAGYHAAPGAVRPLGKALALVARGARHASEHGSGSIPTLDALLQEESLERWATGSGVEGERLLALAAAITLDQVIRVRRHPFAGHVYNLETATGWYLAEGVVAHNCRCSTRPRMPE